METPDKPVRFVYETPCSGNICGWLTVVQSGDGTFVPLMFVVQNAGGVDPLGEGRVPDVPLHNWLNMGHDEALGRWNSADEFWTHMRQRVGWSLVEND